MSSNDVPQDIKDDFSKRYPGVEDVFWRRFWFSKRMFSLCPGKVNLNFPVTYDLDAKGNLKKVNAS